MARNKAQATHALLKKLPPVIYVTKDKDEGYLLATEEPEGGDGDEIGVYELTDLRTIKITRELV